MGKSLVSYRFSLKPIHWYSGSTIPLVIQDFIQSMFVLLNFPLFYGILYACMDGRMDGWMDACMHVCMYVHGISPLLYGMQWNYEIWFLGCCKPYDSCPHLQDISLHCPPVPPLLSSHPRKSAASEFSFDTTHGDGWWQGRFSVLFWSHKWRAICPRVHLRLCEIHHLPSKFIQIMGGTLKMGRMPCQIDTDRRGLHNRIHKS